jgi:DnaJ-class molecular chaperone
VDPVSPYRTLGIAPTASRAEVRQAFRTLARRYHPDASHDSESVRELGEVVRAYRAIGRAGAPAPSEPAPQPRHVDVYA